MRRLFSLFACAFILNQAHANEEPASAPIKAASAPEAVHEAPAKEAEKPAAKEIVKPAPKAAAESAASARTRDDVAAHELSAKIAAKLAAMRAARAAKVAQAAKLAKAKESTAAAAHGVTPVSAMQPPAPDPHWSYEGEGGPAQWAKLSPAWAKCDSGNRQSPIDIHDGFKVDLESIKFDYKPSAVEVIDNGHTVQVNVSGSNSITVMGRTYELVQFHFHRPAEERINGKGFEMVVHLVHKDIDGKLAVVAVMIERGKLQNLIQSVWNNLPLEKNDPVATSAMDIGQILPARREYYTFMGSLTTPPCSEGVLWMVMKEPVQASAEQIAIFSRLYPMNARPLQAAAGRMIKESN